MSITADIIKLRFDVQPKYDQQQMNELKGDLKDTESALKKTHKEIEKNTDSYKKFPKHHLIAIKFDMVDASIEEVVTCQFDIETALEEVFADAERKYRIGTVNIDV